MAVTLPWSAIKKFDVSLMTQQARLDALHSLYGEWQRRLSMLTPEAQQRVRQRTLDKLAIETGVIERLYDIDWGLTLTLVAEGFTRDVVERARGEVSDTTLATIKAQRDSLAMVLEFVGQDRKLTPSLIKELHQAVTQTQPTYRARDQYGVDRDVPLPRGEWKIHPNHVMLADGSLLEYCPPEHVASEIDNLTQWYEELDRSETHPIVKAGWFHHRFVQIHPFADGNGRVARALTTLIMERDRWAPIVVDRHHREDYLDALGAANRGDLNPLVRLFIELEAAGLSGELGNSLEATSTDMARALVERLVWKESEQRLLAEQRNRISLVAGAMAEFFNQKRHEITQLLASNRVTQARVEVESFAIDRNGGIPWDGFGEELVASARKAGHAALLDIVTGTQLRLIVGASEHRLRAAVYRVDEQSGLMAMTAFGSAATTTDAFRFLYKDDLPRLRSRLGDLHALLDRGLASLLAEAMTTI